MELQVRHCCCCCCCCSSYCLSLLPERAEVCLKRLAACCHLAAAGASQAAPVWPLCDGAVKLRILAATVLSNLYRKCTRVGKPKQASSETSLHA